MWSNKALCPQEFTQATPLKTPPDKEIYWRVYPFYSANMDTMHTSQLTLQLISVSVRGSTTRKPLIKSRVPAQADI